MPVKNPYPRIDVPTLVAICVVAYALEIIIHEVIGHGGVCWLVGGQPLAVTSTDFYCNFADVPAWGVKLMLVGGGLANFVTLALCLALLRIKRYRPHAAYFWWVVLNLNCFLASSYLIGSPLLGFGDWNSVVSGLPFSMVWRLILTLIGVGLSFLGIKLSIRALEFQFGGAEAHRDGWMKLFSRVPPFTIGTVAIMMGFVNPLGLKWSISLALASFVALLWMFNLSAWKKPSDGTEHFSTVEINRNLYWLVGGAIALAFLMGILAPGIGSFEGYF